MHALEQGGVQEGAERGRVVGQCIPILRERSRVPEMQGEGRPKAVDLKRHSDAPRGFVEAGAKVYISARKESECATTAAELSAAGGTCVAIPADLSTEAGCKALADAIAA
ncbi:MAG TPA: hypothetical protein DEH78_25870, partial [Solibacterales bacterium]|nr:hypothetical protein [Bryobacterales bacterium]